jgi:hypothetical protein
MKICRKANLLEVEGKVERPAPISPPQKELRPAGVELSPFPRQKRRFRKRAAQNPAHPAHKTPLWTPTWL